MKKTIFYSTLILLSFFIACTDAVEKKEVKTENSGTTVKDPAPNNNVADPSKSTSVSVGPGGADVKHKNTQVNVDKNGVKIGTKGVDIQIKK